MRTINLIVIHCSATKNGDDLFRTGRTPIMEIDGWHRLKGYCRGAEARKRYNPMLTSIGYHFVIYTNGGIVSGRDIAEVGAHAKGHNADSIGICLIGTDRYSDAQWTALADQMTALRKRYPQARIVGHRDLSPDADSDGTVEPHEWLKTCPGFNVAEWLRGGMAPLAAHRLER